MKAFFSTLSLAALFLSACGTSVSVAEPSVVKEYPEQKPVMLAWQTIVEAAEAKNCELLLGQMRISLQLEAEACPDIYEYFEDGAPDVDWSRTDWSTTGGKAKIYELGGGSITSFIHNEADGTWKNDELFWE